MSQKEIGDGKFDTNETTETEERSRDEEFQTRYTITIMDDLCMMTDTIPSIMKITVEDKYFNLICQCDKSKKCQCGPCAPCFTCGKPFRYYFSEIDKIDTADYLI